MIRPVRKNNVSLSGPYDMPLDNCFHFGRVALPSEILLSSRDTETSRHCRARATWGSNQESFRLWLLHGWVPRMERGMDGTGAVRGEVLERTR